jgi:flagellar biosynthesis chaperone FliJ
LTQEETKLKNLEQDYHNFKREMEVMFGKTASSNQNIQQQLLSIQRNVNKLERNVQSTASSS